MTIVKWAGLFLLCFVLQTTIVPVITICGIRPDLLLVALFFLAVKTGHIPAIWTGFFLGLAQDLFSPSILGQNALSKTIAGFCAGFFNERLMRVDIIVQLILLGLTIIVNDMVFFIVQYVKTGGGALGVLHDLLLSSVPRALYSMLFALTPYLKQYVAPSSFRR
jgi:rod shape-determining protein MreD